MKINPKANPLARIQEIKQTADNKAGDVKIFGETKTPSVKISSLASELSKIEEDARNVPDIRSEKVDQIKQGIENGTYQIDEDKLAEVLSKFI